MMRHNANAELFEEQVIIEGGCEVPGCSMPGTCCPACQQCFCWQHLGKSSCETCRKVVSKHSFEHQVGRLMSFGFSVLLLGILFFLLPRDENGIILQLAILCVISGSLLFWIGLLAHT